MADPGGIVLSLGFAAIFFYVLYGVIRAGVRDGILQADDRREPPSEMIDSSGEQE
jgi:hypothetical protein